MLLKPSREQFEILSRKLERSGVSMNGRLFASYAENRVFYQTLNSMGFEDSRKMGRAVAPSYETLGFDRPAGPPTEADIARYAEVTNGGTLTGDGLVSPALFFDNDLIADRYSVATFSLLVDLANKYLGRGNDFNHSFDARQARCRVIDCALGTDPEVQLHPDTPVDAMRKLSPNNPTTGTYTAFFGSLAFPKLETDNGGAWGGNTIESVKAGMTRDLSLAFQPTEGTTYCSACLVPMERFWFWEYCEEHGFPGGRTEDGMAVVAVMDHASDVFTFGLVSDGAIKRAMLVLNPALNPPEIQMVDPEAEETSKFQVGDRVEVIGDPHVEGQDEGTVRSVTDTIVYGIEFDSDPGNVYKWYIEDEIDAEDNDDTPGAPETNKPKNMKNQSSRIAANG